MPRRQRPRRQVHQPALQRQAGGLRRWQGDRCDSQRQVGQEGDCPHLEGTAQPQGVGDLPGHRRQEWRSLLG